jgi:Zn-dependent protease with chaperone function
VPLIWQADYLDGRTPIRQPATVRIMREGLEVTTPGGTRVWPYVEIRQTEGTNEREPVRLERRLDPGPDLSEALVVPDVRFLSSLRDIAGESGQRFREPRRRGRRLLVTALASALTVAIAAALYFWGIPALAGAAAGRVPVSWEARLGQAAMEHLAPPDQVCTNPALRGALEAIAGRLTEAIPNSPYTFRIVTVDRSDVNALATPGGGIIVFRGLLVRTRSAEELAGVLAHEMQHVVRRHAVQAVIQHASVGLLLTALTGDATGTPGYGVHAAGLLARLSYSRQAEEEADREGVALLRDARIDPRGMIDLFERLDHEQIRVPAGVGWFSTHPPTSDRLTRLRSLATRPGPGSTPLLPGRPWVEISLRCGGPS